MIVDFLHRLLFRPIVAVIIAAGTWAVIIGLIYDIVKGLVT